MKQSEERSNAAEGMPINNIQGNDDSVTFTSQQNTLGYSQTSLPVTAQTPYYNPGSQLNYVHGIADSNTFGSSRITLVPVQTLNYNHGNLFNASPIHYVFAPPPVEAGWHGPVVTPVIQTSNFYGNQFVHYPQPNQEIQVVHRIPENQFVHYQQPNQETEVVHRIPESIRPKNPIDQLDEEELAIFIQNLAVFRKWERAMEYAEKFRQNGVDGRKIVDLALTKDTEYLEKQVNIEHIGPRIEILQFVRSLHSEKMSVSDSYDRRMSTDSVKEYSRCRNRSAETATNLNIDSPAFLVRDEKEDVSSSGANNSQQQRSNQEMQTVNSEMDYLMTPQSSLTKRRNSVVVAENFQQRPEEVGEFSKKQSSRALDHVNAQVKAKTIPQEDS